MTEKKILDATAGHRMMWFNKNHPNAVYVDNKPECKPDILCDWKDLSRFPDEQFKLIVFDPPHYIEGWHNPDIKLNQDYGLLKKETWPSDIKIAFRELWRLLKPDGVLLFKWNDHDISFERILKELYLANGPKVFQSMEYEKAPITRTEDICQKKLISISEN